MTLQRKMCFMINQLVNTLKLQIFAGECRERCCMSANVSSTCGWRNVWSTAARRGQRSHPAPGIVRLPLSQLSLGSEGSSPPLQRVAIDSVRARETVAEEEMSRKQRRGGTDIGVIVGAETRGDIKRRSYICQRRGHGHAHTRTHTHTHTHTHTPS